MRRLILSLIALWIMASLSHAATVGQDNFTDTDGVFLDAHTPSGGGGSWSLQIANIIGINTNRAYGLSSAVVSGRKQDDIGSDEMNVSAVANLASGSASLRAGICGRMTTANHTNMICAYLQGSATTPELHLAERTATSVFTDITSAFTGLAFATPYTIRLELRTNSQAVYLDGTLRLSGTNTSNTGQNYAGILLASNSITGRWVDDFLSESVGAAAVRRAIIVNSLQLWPFKAPQEWLDALRAWIRHR